MLTFIATAHFMIYKGIQDFWWICQYFYSVELSQVIALLFKLDPLNYKLDICFQYFLLLTLERLTCIKKTLK